MDNERRGNVLLLRTLPLADDLEQSHVRVDRSRDFLDFRKLRQLKLVELFLLVEPRDLILYVGEPLLHGTHVEHVLEHHVQFVVVGKLVDSLFELVQFDDDLVALLMHQFLAVLFHLLHKLNTASHSTATHTDHFLTTVNTPTRQRLRQGFKMT